MKKMLIIGSEGFLGWNFSRYFAEKFKITGVDVVERSSCANDFIKISDHTNDLKKIFKESVFDFCINCSGSSSVQKSFIDPYGDYLSNVDVVIHLLEAIRCFSPECKFINISSAAVYGNPEKLPVKETDTLNPISPYGFHKMIAENVLQEYSKVFGMKTVSLRIFSAYGPGQKKLFLWDLYQKMKTSENVELFGSGNESRDYIFIDDIAKMVEKVVENSKFEGEQINCASGVESKIKDVAELFAHIFEWNGTINFSKERISGYPDNWKADVSLARSMGFVPRNSIEKGIKEYIKWLKELN